MNDAQAQIERARKSAAWAGRMGRVNIGIGGLAIALGLARYLLSVDRIMVTLEIFLVVGIASITSGVALIATSWNLRLSALRVELQAAQQSGAADPAGIAPQQPGIGDSSRIS